MARRRSADHLLHRFTGCQGTPPLDEAQPEFERALELGPTWALSELWSSLGFIDLFRQALKGSQRHFDGEAAVRLMVFNRICDPDSKLGALRWLEGVVMPRLEVAEIGHHQLLRAMDTLMAHREAIRRGLAKRLLPLIDQELSVVFYDLTTIRIHGEGEVEGDLRRFGLSKELHGPARQFVLGLIQTADGIPLDFEVFEGNVAEVRTLLPMLRRCLERYPIQRTIIVADRGLLSLENLAEVEALEVSPGRRLDYILAVPASRYRDFEEVLGPLRFAAGAQSIRTGQWQGRRVVVVHCPQAAKAQGERRQANLDELVALGEKLAARLDAQDEGASLRGRRASDRSAYARFTRAVQEKQLSRFITPLLSAERFAFEVNEQALTEASQLDGKLVLVTNLEDFEAEDILERYKALADIERGFRVLKRDLGIAPVYHFKRERIEAHAMLCFFALVLHRVLRKRLRKAKEVVSVERAIQYHRVRMGERTWRGVTRMTPQQLELLRLLEVKAPTTAAV